MPYVLGILHEAVHPKCARTARDAGLSVADDTNLRLGGMFLYIAYGSKKVIE